MLDFLERKQAAKIQASQIIELLERQQARTRAEVESATEVLLDQSDESKNGCRAKQGTEGDLGGHGYERDGPGKLTRSSEQVEKLRATR